MAYANIITKDFATSGFNFSALAQNIVVMRAAAKQRHDLSRLTTTQLNDIGVTREQQVAECSLRFWQ